MIEPYQPIDIAIGANRVKVPPKPGYAVCVPDAIFPGQKGVMLTEDAEQASEIAEWAARHSRWPNNVSVFSAWRHSEQSVCGDISDRRFWTPR